MYESCVLFETCTACTEKYELKFGVDFSMSISFPVTGSGRNYDFCQILTQFSVTNQVITFQSDAFQKVKF